MCGEKAKGIDMMIKAGAAEMSGNLMISEKMGIKLIAVNGVPILEITVSSVVMVTGEKKKSNIRDRPIEIAVGIIAMVMLNIEIGLGLLLSVTVAMIEDGTMIVR